MNRPLSWSLAIGVAATLGLGSAADVTPQHFPSSDPCEHVQTIQQCLDILTDSWDDWTIGEVREMVLAALVAN